MVGLTPLVLAAVVMAVAVALTTLVRLLTRGLGFSAEQPAVIITLSIGLVVATAAYVIASRRALRKVAAWQREGSSAQATAALWALAFTAVVVLVPVLLAVVLPQHPAP
jgi:hypothetical protein